MVVWIEFWRPSKDVDRFLHSLFPQDLTVSVDFCCRETQFVISWEESSVTIYVRYNVLHLVFKRSCRTRASVHEGFLEAATERKVLPTVS